MPNGSFSLFLFHSSGRGFFYLPRAVLDPEMVAIHFDKSFLDLHRDHQLRNLLTAEDSAGCGENLPSGQPSVSGPAYHRSCHLCDGDAIVESAGKADPPAETVL